MRINVHFRLTNRTDFVVPASSSSGYFVKVTKKVSPDELHSGCSVSHRQNRPRGDSTRWTVRMHENRRQLAKSAQSRDGDSTRWIISMLITLSKTREKGTNSEKICKWQISSGGQSGWMLCQLAKIASLVSRCF